MPAYCIYRITDEMREHMFDNWTEKDLESMAKFEGETVDDLKERLLEYAAFFDIDNLDDFIPGHSTKVNHTSQLGGAPFDCVTLNVEPQTPTMSSPMSQSSDDRESTFDSRLSALTTPASLYTPAKLKVAENGSPIKQRDTKHDLQMCQTDGSSGDLTQLLYCDGSAVGADGQAIVRIFDPEKSFEHRGVPMNALLAYNSYKNVLHLQGVDPFNGNLQADLQTLVVFIDGVVYEDEDGQAGAAVFFHPLSPWNTVTGVEKTKENAKLEALYIALNMIAFTAANDPSFKAVRIMCAGRDFCLANATGEYSPADREAVDKWLQGADKTMLSEVDKLWTDITEGNNGRRPVDVRLWCVPQGMMRPVTEVATAYMYEQRGRDWYAENGKTRDRFPVNSPNMSVYQHYYDSIVAPLSVVSQGPQAVTKWTAEAKARFQQSLLHMKVASEGCRRINDELRANGMPMSTEGFLEAYARATKLMSENPQMDIDQFVAEQRSIRSSQLQHERTTNGGVGHGNGSKIGGEDQKLVQQVLEMDWE